MNSPSSEGWPVKDLRIHPSGTRVVPISQGFQVRRPAQEDIRSTRDGVLPRDAAAKWLAAHARPLETT